ncbi:MAG: single-stranded-DNA-specific exonuclease RecJ [Dehalococcoidia bacterium]|nr:single-stranded-DNA-specific exonuclease RecJ [Dehalococcoidia bacterium]
MTGERVEAGGGKRWRLLPEATPGLARELGVPLLWAALLHHRGIATRAQAQAFLQPPSVGDPFLLPGMEQAVTRVLLAIRQKERVAVYGDFDADGVTATALLFTALSRLGADVVSYLPHRTREGHGLNAEAIRGLKRDGVSLMVTVDNGITAWQEVELANGLGMETIITDHHAATGPRPAAAAIVVPPDGVDPVSNGTQGLQYLAGAGIAFKLAHALNIKVGRPFDDDVLEMAAIGTIADLAPLVGENRAILTGGLERMRRSQNPGLRALSAMAGVPLGALDGEVLNFSLVPRINAAGRMASAEGSFKLLTARTTEEALPWAQMLEQWNRERQELTQQLVEYALPQAEEQAAAHKLLFLADPAFTPGTNGLVASRLVDQFTRPAIVATAGDGLAWASARSVPDFNLADAFSRVSHLFVRFGGHAGAAGFTATSEALPTLVRELRAVAVEALAGADLTPTLAVDAEVSLRYLLGETFTFLERLAPHGVGNPQPVFLTRGVEVVHARQMGAQGRHFALKVRSEGAVWAMVVFGSRGGTAGKPPPKATRLDVVYTVGRDQRDPAGPPRLVLLDYRPSLS